MLPPYNSFPRLPNQSQQTNALSTPPSQQVMQSNPSVVNSGNLVQNTMQFQRQFGMNNAQIQVPPSNSNAHLNPNMRPSITQPGFMNVPNHVLPLQNNHLGMPHLGSQQGLSHVGFGSQNSVCNMNPVAGFAVNGQFCNLMQNTNQVNASQPPFVHNFPNLHQQLNQNMGLLNGQYGFPNMLQNVNQLVPLQMPASSQVGPYGIPLCPPHMLGGLNQPTQATVPQNPSIFPNMHFGPVHCNQVGQQDNQNQQNFAPPTMNGPVTAQQLKGNSSAPLNRCPVQPPHTKNLQTPVFTWSQGNPTDKGGSNIPSSNWKHSPNKKFTRNSKSGLSQVGSHKCQSHQMKNAKKRSGFPYEHRGKGLSNERSGQFGIANSTNQVREPKRFLSWTYSKREVQQWREARKKNYPSKSNIEKKQAAKLSDSEGIDRDAKLRKVQLKEILAKQAELGVEVAEVPSHYLSDTEKRGHGREENKRQLNKKGRFQNKFNKRGRCNKKDRLAKIQRLEEKDSSVVHNEDKDSSNVPSLNKRMPTLLQKLLSADIGRDKRRMLQVFRFMVMNSFFKDWPDKPLKFPLVIVNESWCEDDAIEEKSSAMGKDAEDDDGESDGEDAEDDGGESEDRHDDENEGNSNADVKIDAQVKKVSCFVRREGSIGVGIESPEEEEGEIID
ncbi:hypothetical protein I3842_13G047100 [Carya illinoinensis]|uniref:FMR1-interacting protein 1 conserved domain-containing protein n=1 Tax=Carya illinoinensis TaxID=32201 RepID=A0A922ANB8_CARIL|nr:hypothetical protein I3842_13G047100 [Carya illinoinensis]